MVCTDQAQVHIVALLRVQKGGLAFIAAQCSSWIWLSRSSTKRSSKNPLGDEQCPSTLEGNRLNSRVELLCVLAHLIGVFWVIEQPANSLFFSTPAMTQAMLQSGAIRTSFHMKDFGHPSCKGTLLVETSVGYPELVQQRHVLIADVGARSFPKPCV